MPGNASLFILLCVCVGAAAAQGQKTITAESGQKNVTLPCQAPHNNIIVVEWSRADLELEYVILYRDGHFVPDNQHPSFQNRVDLLDRQMKDGDVSLILKDVTTADSGTYECRVFMKRSNRRKRAHLKTDPISSIYLSVFDPPGQPGGSTEDGGKKDGGEKDEEKEDGGKEDGGKEAGGEKDEEKEDGGKEAGGEKDEEKEDGGKEDGGKEAGGEKDEEKEDGGKEAGGEKSGSVGLIIVFSVVFAVAVVVVLIYITYKKCCQDSHRPPTEPQIEMSERFLNSGSPADEHRDRNDPEANSCHQHSTRIPDVTLTLENELLPPQQTAGLLPERVSENQESFLCDSER